MADDHVAAAKKHLAESKERRDKANKEHEERVAHSKPTPTQEENDLAKLGASVHDKQADGSAPDPHRTKQMEAKPAAGGGYQTRAAQPKS